MKDEEKEVKQKILENSQEIQQRLSLLNKFHTMVREKKNLISNVIEEAARHYLQRALLESKNKTEAAKLIVFSNYQILNNWLERYKV
ncbi:MAG: hypothetical protein ACR2LT_01385 [Pyrinomonadaceae bacterium]